MSASDTAHFIADRALTLVYEARRFPAATPTARAWLRQAVNWAVRRRQFALCGQLNQHLHTIGYERSES